MASRANQNLIRKWQRWLKRIRTHLINLAAYREVFRESHKVIVANEQVRVGGAFLDLFYLGYATYASLEIRKQLDSHKKSISLKKLLCNIAEHPSVLSRRRMNLLYQQGQRAPSNVPERIHRSSLKQLAMKQLDRTGRMGRDHINSARVMRDLSSLKKSLKVVKKYADKEVAHLNNRRLRQLPSFGELDLAIDKLFELYKTYEYLVTGTAVCLEGSWGYDWKSVLKVPWIQSS